MKCIPCVRKNTYMSNLENNYHYVVFHSAMLQIITEITMLTLLIFPFRGGKRESKAGIQLGVRHNPCHIAAAKCK